MTEAGNPRQGGLVLLPTAVSNNIYALHVWCRSISYQDKKLVIANFTGDNIVEAIIRYWTANIGQTGPITYLSHHPSPWQIKSGYPGRNLGPVHNEVNVLII